MAEIRLVCGAVALVDDDQVDRMGAEGWRRRLVCRRWYAIGRLHQVGDFTFMHRAIMDAGHGQQVDHINGDGLDNRRKNLRFCTNSQNQQNRRFITSSTGFKGVTFNKGVGRYQAQIKINGRGIYLGIFPSAEEAAAVYDAAAIQHFGEFAATNAALRLSGAA